MKNLYYLAVVLLLSVFVGAQTETVINNAGATVVEFITQNAAGIPQTQILQTIVGSSSSQTLATSRLTTSTSLSQTTALALTTSTPQQVGPVGQPASLGTAGGVTPYDYTTTNANGDTVTLQGVFTPTGPQTLLPVPTTTGSILGYSQWLSMIGTYTAAPNAAHRMSMSMATGWYYFAATTLAGLVGGAWLITL